MNEHRERDDVALTRFVLRFRRFARLAAADPLRLLPPDPLAPLASLGAPVTALLAVAPFERLQHALASAAPDARGNVSRARVQPLASSGSRTRPHATPALADHISRAVAARDAGSPTARRDAPPSQMTDARSREGWAHRAAPSTAALAQRRAALRRNLLPAGTRSQSSSPVAVQAPTATRNPSGPPTLRPGVGAARGGARVTNRPGAGAARAGERVTGEMLTPAARLLPPLPAESRVVERDDRPVPVDAPTSAPPGTHRLEPSHRPRSAGADGFVHPVQSAAAAGNREVTSSLDARAGSPDALGLPPPTARAESPARPEAARRPRPGDHHAGLECTDDVFEALYRDGVDLSWP